MSFGSNVLIVEILLLTKILLKIKDLVQSCFLKVLTNLSILQNLTHYLQA